MRPIVTYRLIAVAMLILAAGCRDATSPQPGVTPPPANQPSRRAVGLMEITVTGIRGAAQPVASARAIAGGGGTSSAPGSRGSDRAPAARATSCSSCGRELAPLTEGDGTVQLEPLSTSTFTIGTRGAGGYRYVSATYRVRNAPMAGGTGYTTPRSNLTFVAVSQTSGTLAGTNISQLFRFDGSAANPAIAAQMIPTGLAALGTSGQIVSSGPDVLQLFTESEVAGLDTLAGIASALPYGFVVRENPAGSGPRAMAANAADDEFGGIVTFAYRYPLQSTAAADPFAISGRFLVVDDNETWIALSGEELVGGGYDAFASREAALGASPRALFNTVAGTGANVCRVRSAGTAASPTAFLANLVTGTFGITVTGATLEPTGTFAVFSTFPFLAPDASNIAVNSFQTGRAFVNDAYTGAGTTTVRTPAGHYRAGEEIEATFVTGGYNRPQNAFCPGTAMSSRYPVASVPATGEFSSTPFSGLPAQRIVTGDVNGDGNLDLVTISGGDVKVSAGNGAGAFGSWSTVSTGVSTSGAVAVGLGDVNGDGHLDIVAAVNGNLVSLLNDGSGGFTTRKTQFSFADPSEVRLADWNRDGKLDAAVAVAGGDPLVMIFNGDGAGGFTLRTGLNGPGSPAAGTSIAWADFIPDGGLDIAASSGDANTIAYAYGGGSQLGAATSIATGSYTRVVRAADLAGDGYRDLVVGTDAGLSIYPGTAGGFTSPGSLAIGPVRDIAVADVDGDHDLDVLAIVDLQLRLFINNGGSLSESPASPMLTGNVGAGDHIAVGDYNNDGSVDAAVTSGASGQVYLLLNTNLFDVVSAAAISNTQVVVTFDAVPNASQAGNAANYSIPGLTVSGAVAAGSTVTLTTSSLASNSYTLTVSSVTRASDGRTLDDGSVNFDTPSLQLQSIATGLSDALFATSPPGDTHRLFVVQQNGIMRLIRDDVLQSTPFLDLSGVIKFSGEQGLLGLAFHPSYASNGRFFVYYIDPGNHLTVARFNVSSNPDVADPGSGTVLLSIPHPNNTNHNGGMLLFGADGYLYASTGDGGGTGDPDNNAQDSTKLLGKILRIDVDGGSPYAIPPSNPFVGRLPAAPEVWAYGLRNPWRPSVDRLTGDLYIADVGQDNWEEIDFAPAGDAGGHNYGWPTMEGTHCYSPSSGCVTTGLVLPVYEYSHGGGNGCSITGGYVYRGTRIPWLYGRYLFSDWCSGKVASLRVSSGAVTDVQDHSSQVGPLSSVTSFGQDAAGELYIVADGTVYRIEPH